jgi:hypothetical protein
MMARTTTIAQSSRAHPQRSIAPLWTAIPNAMPQQ